MVVEGAAGNRSWVDSKGFALRCLNGFHRCELPFCFDASWDEAIGIGRKKYRLGREMKTEDVGL